MEAQTTQLTFGQKLISLRETAGRTQFETAALLRKRLDNYIKLEIDFLYPSEAMLRKAAKLYNLTIEELIASTK